MATKSLTKAELNEALQEAQSQINALDGDLRSMTRDRDEHRSFKEHATRDRDEAIAALYEIVKVHTPFADPTNFVRGENRDNEPWGVTMRCGVCHTKEHHTRAEKNYEVWPCPTVKPILRLREEWERAQEERKAEAVEERRAAETYDCGIGRTDDATELENLFVTTPWQKTQEWRDSVGNTWKYSQTYKAWRLFYEPIGEWRTETPDSAFGPYTRIEP